MTLRYSMKFNVISELQISFGVNWVLVSIGYLCNLIILNCVLAKSIAYFFLPHVFCRNLWLQIMSAMFFACIYIIHSHRLPFKSIKLADFIVPLKLISSSYKLIFIARKHIASFTSMFFQLNT